MVKSHGGADIQGFSKALERAINAARQKLPVALSPLLEHANQTN